MNTSIHKVILLYALFVNVSGIYAASIATPTTSSSSGGWLKQMKSFRRDIRDCVKLSAHKSTWDCFKAKSLNAFDNFISAKEIPVHDGIKLVYTKDDRDRSSDQNDDAKSLLLSYNQRKDYQYLTWFDNLSMKVAKILSTHTLQINLNDLTNAYMKAMDRNENNKGGNPGEEVATARHRRHRQNMIITMMFGVTALGAVLIPMGFQMLSIVSGKALLLAKMALLLASINGLKRVANSGVHYGLYHVPGEHYGGYYDRGDVHHPRNGASVAIAQPVELGIRK